MNCNNCGTLNNETSKFCIKCGQSLDSTLTNNVEVPMQNQQPMQQTEQPQMQTVEQPMQQTVQTQVQNVQQPMQQPIQSQMQNAQQPMQQTVQNINNVQGNTKISFMGYFILMLAVILKPFTTFKEELNKFSSFKNSTILSLMVSGIATIINLFTTMWNAVRVKDYGWLSTDTSTKWVWSNLKELKYIEIIGKNFLIYLGIILAIAAVYYIASLIIKKQPNFSRLLGISVLSVVPMLICSLILSPLLGMIWIKLSMPITIIGAVYSILLIYEGMNNEVLVDGNTKYYFNLICMSILGIGLYYLYTKMFVSSVSSELNNILDMFG